GISLHALPSGEVTARPPGAAFAKRTSATPRRSRTVARVLRRKAPTSTTTPSAKAPAGQTSCVRPSELQSSPPRNGTAFFCTGGASPSLPSAGGVQTVKWVRTSALRTFAEIAPRTTYRPGATFGSCQTAVRPDSFGASNVVPSGRVTVIRDHVTPWFATRVIVDASRTVEPSSGDAETRAGPAVTSVLAAGGATNGVWFATVRVNGATAFAAASCRPFE